jgi:hypothetical protein
MRNISDLFAFENYATFDRIRPLKWCNAAMLHAGTYYKAIFDKEVTYDQLMSELLQGNLRAIVSLVYGAARAADNTMTAFRFSQVYREDNLKDYSDAALAGVKEYLPDPETQDSGKNLDESYPDTQAEAQKKTKEKVKDSIGDSGSGSQKASSSSRTKNSSTRRKKPSSSSTKS